MVEASCPHRDTAAVMTQFHRGVGGFLGSSSDTLALEEKIRKLTDPNFFTNLLNLATFQTHHQKSMGGWVAALRAYLAGKFAGRPWDHPAGTSFE